MRKDTEATGRLAEYSHVLRIPSECRDISLNPSQRELLVHNAVITRDVVGGFCSQCGMREEA